MIEYTKKEGRQPSRLLSEEEIRNALNQNNEIALDLNQYITTQIYVTSGKVTKNPYNLTEPIRPIFAGDENRRLNITVTEDKEGQITKGLYYSLEEFCNFVYKILNISAPGTVAQNISTLDRRERNGKILKTPEELKKYLEENYSIQIVMGTTLTGGFINLPRKYILASAIPKIMENLKSSPDTLLNKYHTILQFDSTARHLIHNPEGLVMKATRNQMNTKKEKPNGQNNSKSPSDFNLFPETKTKPLSLKNSSKPNKTTTPKNPNFYDGSDDVEIVDMGPYEHSTLKEITESLENYMTGVDNVSKNIWKNVKRKMNKKNQATLIALALAATVGFTAYSLHSKATVSKESSQATQTPTKMLDPSVIENENGKDEEIITTEATLEDLYENITIGGSFYISQAPLSASADSDPVGKISQNSEYSQPGNYSINRVAFVPKDGYADQLAMVVADLDEINNSISEIMQEKNINSNQYKIMVHICKKATDLDNNENAKGWTEVTKEVFADLMSQLEKVEIHYNPGGISQ